MTVLTRKDQIKVVEWREGDWVLLTIARPLLVSPTLKKPESNEEYLRTWDKKESKKMREREHKLLEIFFCS